MQAVPAIITVVSKSGKPKTEISLELGRHYTFVGKLVSQRSIPKLSTAAEIADACGYDLLFRSRSTGEEIIVDPPETE